MAGLTILNEVVRLSKNTKAESLLHAVVLGLLKVPIVAAVPLLGTVLRAIAQPAPEITVSEPEITNSVKTK